MKQHPKADLYPRPLLKAGEAVAARGDLISRKDATLALSPAEREFKTGLGPLNQASTFSACFGCQTCANVCAVVANYENPQDVLGLLPH